MVILMILSLIGVWTSELVSGLLWLANYRQILVCFLYLLTSQFAWQMIVFETTHSFSCGAIELYLSLLTDTSLCNFIWLISLLQNHLISQSSLIIIVLRLRYTTPLYTPCCCLNSLRTNHTVLIHLIHSSRPCIRSPWLMTSSWRLIINSHLLHIGTHRSVITRTTWVSHWMHSIRMNSVLVVKMMLIILRITILPVVRTSIPSRLRHLRFVSLTERAYSFSTDLSIVASVIRVVLSMISWCMATIIAV